MDLKEDIEEYLLVIHVQNLHIQRVDGGEDICGTLHNYLPEKLW